MTDDLDDNPYMKFLKETGKEIVKAPQQQAGMIWISILVRFTPDGKSEIVKSFSSPAKDSSIKGVFKKKKQDYKQEIVREESNESEDLFQ